MANGPTLRLVLGGGVELLLVFLLTSPRTVFMEGADDAGMRALLRVCVITRSLALR